MKFAAVVLFCFSLAASPLASSQAGSAKRNWVGSWSASQQLPEPQNALASDDLRDATLRQIVHLSIGGSRLRVHLSNAFGTTPLHLTAIHIARPISAASTGIDSTTDKGLLFAGKGDVIIPAGAEYISDPIDFA